LLGVGDPIAAGTHALATLAAAWSLVPLWLRSAGSSWKRISVMVFGLSNVALFAASAAYHTATDPVLKDTLRHIDHAVIYVLIAGTFTALSGNLNAGKLRLVVLTTIWSLAAVGIVLKVFFFEGVPEWLDVAYYLTMGWLGIVPTVPIMLSRGIRSAIGIVGAALFYTLGAICELQGWCDVAPGIFGHHEVFHLAVMAASACFYTTVFKYVLPPLPEEPALEFSTVPALAPS
jgi:hemolysin III